MQTESLGKSYRLYFPRSTHLDNVSKVGKTKSNQLGVDVLER